MVLLLLLYMPLPLMGESVRHGRARMSLLSLTLGTTGLCLRHGHRRSWAVLSLALSVLGLQLLHLSELGSVKALNPNCVAHTHTHASHSAHIHRAVVHPGHTSYVTS